MTLLLYVYINYSTAWGPNFQPQKSLKMGIFNPLHLIKLRIMKFLIRFIIRSFITYKLLKVYLYLINLRIETFIIRSFIR